MADLSKIKLNGVEYNIKDATARTLAQSSDWEAESEEAGYIDNKPSVKAGTGTDAVISGLIEDTTVNNTTYSANVASGNYSYAEGFNTTAFGNNSHTEGAGTVTNSSFTVSNLNNSSIEYSTNQNHGL